jgi:hypothetical protein
MSSVLFDKHSSPALSCVDYSVADGCKSRYFWKATNISFSPATVNGNYKSPIEYLTIDSKDALSLIDKIRGIDYKLFNILSEGTVHKFCYDIENKLASNTEFV